MFPYAYNVPRPHFDDALLAKAIACGVDYVTARAQLMPNTEANTGAELRLGPETLAAAPGLAGRQPDLIVDATGRARLAARALGIPARLGPRKDVAHFAHFEGFSWDDAPGQVRIARGEAGWSWCIPLQERLSIGIVLGQDDAARLGRTPEERLDHAIAADPGLTSIVGSGRRVTDVATYANYQLISERGYGRGWVMIGDAFGFVDPMLSPGVFLALRSSEQLADAMTPWLRRRAIPTPAELDAVLTTYAADQSEMLSAWLELVAYLYDGRLAALIEAGPVLDAGASWNGQAGDANPHRATRRPAGQRRGDDVTLQPWAPAFPGPLRFARRRPGAPRHPLTAARGSGGWPPRAHRPWWRRIR